MEKSRKPFDKGKNRAMGKKKEPDKDIPQGKMEAAAAAAQLGDFHHAVALYTEIIQGDGNNYIAYCNRSVAYHQMGLYKEAVQDARKAKELSPGWSKAYYREGVALQAMGRDAESLAALAAGLAQDPKNEQLLATMVETALNSAIKDNLKPIFEQLEQMSLDKSAFVLTSVIGQELLATGCFAISVVVLEAALRIGTSSQKLKGSVYSALCSAHWALGNLDKAIGCMQQDLAVATALGDKEGECRVNGNLGSAFFTRGSYREALLHHQAQLRIAMQLKQRAVVASALSCLGHIYMATGDYTKALDSHKQCVIIVRQAGEKLKEAREVGNVGSVYLAMGDFEKAVECHQEHLNIARKLKNKVEEARAFSNLGSAYHYRRDYIKAVEFHRQVLNIAESARDRTLEARAYAGLGHASRCNGDNSQAKFYHEKQLDNALQTKDKVGEGRACSNLGIIFQSFGDSESALKLHKSHLNIAKKLGDRASQGRAYGNMGNAYSAMGQYHLAVRFHKQELAISREVNDKHSEASTHGNLAVAYQALQIEDKALLHYQMHLKLSKELHNTASEARANSNLGNFYSGQGRYNEALPFYEQFLSLSQELKDSEGESQACHKLGYAHYSLTNYKEAIRYYEQDLSIAKQMEDKVIMSRAYCNLGLAHKALKEFSEALVCQNEFLTLSMSLKNLPAQFKALGNIGDLHLQMENAGQAIQMYNKQLQLAKCMKEKKNEALALRNLGNAQKQLKQYEKSLSFHNQELSLWQEINDTKGLCVAHGYLGNLHMTLGNYGKAVQCYEEQLDCGRGLHNSALEAQAYGNLGIAKMNMAEFEEAIGMFEQQLAMLEQVRGKFVMQDRGQAYGNLGNCYQALGDFEEAVKCFEQYLTIAQSSEFPVDQGKAYHGLGDTHRAMGNLQQALVCFEKRLFVAHGLDDASMKASAYGELGCLHSLLGNFEQAITCLQHQLTLARALGNQETEGDAACGLGGVYQQMGDHHKAVEFHELDLDLASKLDNRNNLCRAYGNLGLSHESLGQFEQAIEFQEQHLTLAGEVNDKSAKTLALCSLGRIYHAMGKYNRSIQYLQQGLQLAEQLQHREEEAKIRHRLGLAFWGQGQLRDSQEQLYRAAELFELIRRDAQANSEYKLSLFDLQTACYQALQRVLVSLKLQQEALVVAERGRTRAFVDLLLERQTDGDDWYSDMESTPVTLDQLLSIVSKQKASVLYFSLAAGYLYSWYLTPEKGIVKFHERSIADLEHNSDPEDVQSLHSLNVSSVSVLDQYVGHVRESLGVDTHAPNMSRLPSSKSASMLSETESEADEQWHLHLEEIGDKLNAENDRVGFLRMVNRNHILNASSYSLSSLLSFSSSLNSQPMSRTSSTRAESGQPPLSALYELLIQPMEDVMEAKKNAKQDLVLVLQGDLYLVPFALMRPTQPSLCLFERFNLLVVPSIKALQASHDIGKQNQYNPDCMGTVVFGNPKIPQTIAKQWEWGEIPHSENECRFVSELMGCGSFTGTSATKDLVLQKIQRAEVVHLATHISWKLAAIVLSAPDANVTSHTSINGKKVECMDLESSCSDVSSLVDGPSLSEFLLSAADVLNLKITAKLVVLSSVHSEDRAGRINTDGVVGLTRAFLAAGAQCVLFSLWPVPPMAARMLLKAFYTSMLQGSPCSQALSEAMKSVQSTRQFSHPSNWASWVLVGSDVRLSSKVALMGHALCEILKTPERAREAMRVVLHLVEKSLHRIQHGQRNAMYTTQQSIQNKVGQIQGWRQLLESVGFRFEAAMNELPASVFFPTADPGDRLTQCSASLQALLGLPVPTLAALSKLLSQPDAGEALTMVLKEVNGGVGEDGAIRVGVSVRLWRVPGCHEFLASIGFDLVDIGKEEVTVKAGKHASRRNLQFAHQALIALFDTHQAPRSLMIDSSSSMESLCSTGSATSTSNFSKGSTPPTSPNSRQKKSIFNPAEVEKLPSARHRHHGGVASKTVSGSKSMPDLSIQLSHMSNIRTKYCSGSDDNSADEQQLPRVLSVDICDAIQQEGSSSEGPSPTQSSRPRPKHSLFDRGGVKTYFPQPPRMYSTSTSDSEEAVKERKQNLSNLSQSRNSLASNSSTLTARSSNSSVLRRNRNRSSALSVRSSASDRTLTEEPVSNKGKESSSSQSKREFSRVHPRRRSTGAYAEEYSLPLDHLPNLTMTKHNDNSEEDPYSLPFDHITSTPMPRGDAFVNKINLKPNVTPIMAHDHSKSEPTSGNLETSHGGTPKISGSLNASIAALNDSDVSSVSQNVNISDPTLLAQKVLAETKGQRLALEKYQQSSMVQLRIKQMNDLASNTTHQGMFVDSKEGGNEIDTADVKDSQEKDTVLISAHGGRSQNSDNRKDSSLDVEAKTLPSKPVNENPAPFKLKPHSNSTDVQDEIIKIQLQKLNQVSGNTNVKETVTATGPSVSERKAAFEEGAIPVSTNGPKTQNNPNPGETRLGFRPPVATKPVGLVPKSVMFQDVPSHIVNSGAQQECSDTLTSDTQSDSDLSYRLKKTGQPQASKAEPPALSKVADSKRIYQNLNTARKLITGSEGSPDVPRESKALDVTETSRAGPSATSKENTKPENRNEKQGKPSSVTSALSDFGVTFGYARQLQTPESDGASTLDSAAGGDAGDEHLWSPFRPGSTTSTSSQHSSASSTRTVIYRPKPDEQVSHGSAQPTNGPTAVQPSSDVRELEARLDNVERELKLNEAKRMAFTKGARLALNEASSNPVKKDYSKDTFLDIKRKENYQFATNGNPSVSSFGRQNTSDANTVARPWYESGDSPTHRTGQLQHFTGNVQPNSSIHTYGSNRTTGPKPVAHIVRDPPPYPALAQSVSVQASGSLSGSLRGTSESPSSSGSEGADIIREQSRAMFSSGKLVGHVAPQPRELKKYQESSADMVPEPVAQSQHSAMPQQSSLPINHQPNYQDLSSWNSFVPRPFIGAARSIDTIPEESEVSSVISDNGQSNEINTGFGVLSQTTGPNLANGNRQTQKPPPPPYHQTSHNIVHGAGQNRPYTSTGSSLQNPQGLPYNQSHNTQVSSSFAMQYQPINGAREAVNLPVSTARQAPMDQLHTAPHSSHQQSQSSFVNHHNHQQPSHLLLGHHSHQNPSQVSSGYHNHQQPSHVSLGHQNHQQPSQVSQGHHNHQQPSHVSLNHHTSTARFYHSPSNQFTQAQYSQQTVPHHQAPQRANVSRTYSHPPEQLHNPPHHMVHDLHNPPHHMVHDRSDSSSSSSSQQASRDIVPSSSATSGGRQKVVKLPPAKPNGPLRMLLVDSDSSMQAKDKVFQLSKC